MSMSGPVFVTASDADYKAFNRFLLDVRDWEHGSGDRFAIVNTKNAYEMGHRESEDPSEPGQFTEENFESPWAGLDIKDVEAFCIDAAKASERQEPALFLVLDERGLQDETVVLANRRFDEDVNYTDIFEKVRMPWTCVYSMWCNLDIANMNFEEFCEGEESDEDGWWGPNDFAKNIDGDLSDENREQREEERERLQDAGMI